MGMRPLSSKGSFGSIAQTEAAYHKVRPPETKAHNNGKPESGQKQGTEPKKRSRTQYTFDWKTVCSAPRTSFIMGMFTFPYSPER